MKPLSLEFQAFGPYAGKEHIDFEDLTSKGLLLICGDTGSGKTMILDAMTMALYGKSSGGIRNDFESLRCNRCKSEDDTYIEFVFEAGGSVYKFERRLTKKRVNLSESLNISRMDQEGIFEPLKEKVRKNDLPAFAEELIGLDYEQFTQVIILPQGKFEQFLESDSGKKGEILSEIFGAGRWEAIARTYYDKVRAEYDQLSRLKESVESVLNSEGCQDLEELENKRLREEESLRALEAEFKSVEYEARRLKLSQQRQAAIEIETLRKNLMQRQKEAELTEASVSNNAERLAAAEKDLKAHQAAEDTKKKQEEEINLLRGKIEIYTNADLIKRSYKEAEKTWSEATSRAEKAQKAADKSAEAETKALREYELADIEHKEALEAFARGAAGRLAADLKEGEKCPVCGSTHHPDPAVSEEKSVSSDVVDRKYRDLTGKHDLWDQARKKTEEARKTASQCQSDMSEAQSALKVAEKALEDSRAGMIEGIDDLSQLNGRITKLDRAVAAYDKELERLKDSLSDIRISLAEAETGRNKAAEEKSKAEKELADTLVKFTDQGSKEEPDKAAIDKDLQKLEDIKARYQTQQGAINTEVKRLSELRERLSKDWEDYSSRISDAEDALAFARHLRGDTSIGLGRYVLGIMFDQVIYAANEMLSKVHGGRYSLVRTEESLSGSRKKGLDLAVIDSFSDTGNLRSAGSLSGGEKFLVSLALSIGLSTIARTDGINIDAMFIDEGFGSLDENSIGDALEILESIRSNEEGGSFVGIISHVQILRDSIPSKLIVRKSRRSSTIEYTLG